MTVYDLSFIFLFLGAIGILLAGGILAHLGRRRAAAIIFRGLTASAIMYVATWVVVTTTSKQRPLGVGNPQCIDNWCLAVEDVRATPSDRTVAYDVTLCIFSRANRTPTSFGAHSASDETTDVYLVDDQGRRYHPLPHGSEIPLNITLAPGQAIRTRRSFELPETARNIGLLAGNGSFGACPMVAECSTSHSAGDYLLASGVYSKGSDFLTLVNHLKRNAEFKPAQWR